MSMCGRIWAEDDDELDIGAVFNTFRFSYTIISNLAKATLTVE